MVCSPTRLCRYVSLFNHPQLSKISPLKEIKNYINREPSSELSIVDFHAHIPNYDERNSSNFNVEKFKQFSNRSRFTVAISDAYRIKAIVSDHIFKIRNALNDDLSKLYSSSNKYFGLCGINFDWKDYLVEANRCLSIDRNIGVKIHMGFLGQNLQRYQSKFRELSKILNARRKIMLVHFSSEEKTDVLSSIVKDYPNASFVIAHGAAAQGINLIRLSELTSTSSRKNVYVDTSAFYSMYSSDSSAANLDPQERFNLSIKNDTSSILPSSFWSKNPQVINDWSALGLDKILFGTDYPMGSYNQLKFIFECPLLNDEEKRSIVGGNAEKLLGFVFQK